MHGLSSLIVICVPISGCTCNMGPRVIAQKTPRLLRSPPMEQGPSALGRPRWGFGGGFWTSIKLAGACQGDIRQPRCLKIRWKKCPPFETFQNSEFLWVLCVSGCAQNTQPQKAQPWEVCTSQTSTLQPHAGANNHLYG